jgi:very-long-chain (3R)-3-hydroxyacyl-CoA dehydratase
MAKDDKKQPLGLVQIYLVLSNIVSAVGWLGIYIICHKSLLEYRTSEDLLKSKNLYNNVSYWLRLFQSLALLEVLHAAFKLVRSNPFLTFIQILSRLLVVWIIMGLFEPVRRIISIFYAFSLIVYF